MTMVLAPDKKAQAAHARKAAAEVDSSTPEVPSEAPAAEPVADPEPTPTEAAG
jgi:hypothetical protein